MSVPRYVKGQYFDVAVDVTGLGITPAGGGAALAGFVYFCGLNTRNLTHTVNTSDEAVRDCEKPGTAPWRVLNETSQQKEMAGTGVHNLDQADLVRAIFGRSLPYRFYEGQPGATPDDTTVIGAWEGPFMLTSWQEGAADGTNVSSQFTFQSDGAVLWRTLAQLTAEDQ